MFLCGTALSHAQNRSMNFDGTDDYVDIGNNTALTPSSLTIEAYVKFNALPSLHAPILSKYDTYVGNETFGLSILSTGKIRFAVYANMTDGTYADTNAALSLNTWYDISATFDMNSKTMKIYINGSEVPISAANFGNSYNSLHSNNTSVKIGSMRTQEGTNRYFNGNIDEVRFWNYARTATEIQNNYNTEITGTETGLIAYYKMDLDNNCGVWDCSSNKFHGTLAGTSGTNNLPQYSTDIPTLTDVACGVANVCSSLATINPNFKNNITVAPNPFTNDLNIVMQENGFVNFYDVSGKFISFEILKKGNNSLKKSELAAGIYFYQIMGKDKIIISSGKVMKK